MRARPNGGIKAWHFARRATSPSTISRWRRTWRVKSAEFVRRDVVTESGRQPDNESQLVANNINSVLQRATATSVQEIDKLITELQAMRDMLHREAARVQREIVQYSTLTQAALQSTKTIAESLEQWRKAPDLRTVSD